MFFEVWFLDKQDQHHLETYYCRFPGLTLDYGIRDSGWCTAIAFLSKPLGDSETWKGLSTTTLEGSVSEPVAEVRYSCGILGKVSCPVLSSVEPD